MFSGLIQQIGTISGKDPQGIHVLLDNKKVRLGDSIAINGVCLTAVKVTQKKKGTEVYFQLSAETLQKTTLGNVPIGQKVNIEKALSAADALGGHIVQGHVDGVGCVKKIIPEGDMKTILFSAPPEVMTYVVSKGSVAVDGVSLTVAELTKTDFSVAMIPFTLNNTNMGRLKAGEAVNLEADIIGKYVSKYLKKE